LEIGAASSATAQEIQRETANVNTRVIVLFSSLFAATTLDCRARKQRMPTGGGSRKPAGGDGRREFLPFHKFKRHAERNDPERSNFMV
jgi:hypothetical protein